MTINDDGVSIKGCTLIYAPKGQAGEYAPLASNPYRGCGLGVKHYIKKDLQRFLPAGYFNPLRIKQHH